MKLVSSLLESVRNSLEVISCHCIGTTLKLPKSGKTEGMFLRVGWAELHQTGGECSQTIFSGQVCFRISKSCPISAQMLLTDGPPL